MEATKRPWEAVERQDGTFDIWTKASKISYTILVATVRRSAKGLQEQVRADARLIVTAVNNFEEAIGACKSALRALEDNLRPGPMDEDAKVAIRALLAKVGG